MLSKGSDNSENYIISRLHMVVNESQINRNTYEQVEYIMTSIEAFALTLLK